MSFVILLKTNVLWKSLHASGPAIFGSIADAKQTISGFFGRGALADPQICEVVRFDDPAAISHSGYHIRRLAAGGG